MPNSKFQIPNSIQIILIILALLLSVSFAILPLIGQAAQFSLTSEHSEFPPGQEFQITLFLDTQQEEINALEGEIVFPENLLEVKEIRDGSSFVTFWIERPALRQKDRIRFSGIIPGGVTTERAFIFSLVFRTIDVGAGTVSFQDIRVLLNDGEGTQAALTALSYPFQVTSDATGVPAPGTPTDTIAPEEFSLEVVQDPNVFEGLWFLVFDTQDKGSGISYYEVQERTREGIKANAWKKGQSPYMLKDQSLRSFIYVKAVDKAGNERISILSPLRPRALYQDYLTWVLGIISLIVIILIVIFNARRDTYAKEM